MTADKIRHLRPVDPSGSAPYSWPIEFERSLLHACVYHPRFWSMLGTHLEAQNLREPRGAEILRASAAIAKEAKPATSMRSRTHLISVSSLFIYGYADTTQV